MPDETREPLDVIQGLRAQLADYLLLAAISPATRAAYEYKWGIWQEHCQSLPFPVDPSDAPFGAYTALLSREDLSPDALSRLLSAIRFFYSEQGRTPAYREPGNLQRWRTLQRGHARKYGRQNPNETPRKARPLTRDHARLLLTCTPERTPVDLAYTALLLLHLDLGIGPAALSRLTETDVVLHGDNTTLTVLGHVVPCDHVERVRGVPWDCTACAVRDVMRSHAPSPLFLFSALGSSPDQIAKLFSQAFRRTGHRHYPHLLERTGPHGGIPRFRDEATGYDIAGVRRGLVLLLGVPGGPKLVRARAWAAVAWTNGMRMASDLLEVRRAAVREDPRGAGFSIVIGRTKSDQSASRGTVKTVQWAGSAGAREVAEYLCCRDAMVGREGFFLVPSTACRFGRGGAFCSTDRPIERSTAENDLEHLVSLAGLAHEGYTPYSLRRGNATQRNLDGQGMERIRDELGHRRAQTTSRYIDPLPGDEIAARLLDGLSK